jgi:multidrug efflux pump subunit AcrA (membrane-fusion protein)
MDHNSTGNLGSLGTAAAPGPQIDAESLLWAAFAAAGSTEALCRSWLSLQCRTIDGVDGAMLLLARPGQSFAPIAVWPDAAQNLEFLKPVAEECVSTGAPVVMRPPHENGAAGLHVAYPFLADGDHPVGVVVLDMKPRAEDQVRPMLRRLHWGIGWLEAAALRDLMTRERLRVAHAAAALDLVAVTNEHDRLDAAAIALVNELATRLGASRVALGLDDGRGVRLVALSHTAWFKRNTALVQGLQSAMDEAIDQRVTIRLPPPPGEAARIQVAHEAMRNQWDSAGSIVTFPLSNDRGAVGAITVVHDAAPSEPTVRLGEAVSALLGPILDSKRRARRLISGRIIEAAHDALAAVIGPRHLGWKLVGGVTAAAVAASLLIPTPFRVSAKAVLEGRIQRAIPAPFEGFIATAPVHAGDMVKAGDVLATLDDKDLKLEQVRWRSERERLLLKLREAMAKHDPASGSQIEAQLRQTEAQLSLTTEKLARTQIVAPIGGLVVSGDLSQSIGAPVETGKVLFEVAPLDEYRVMIRLDERDLRYVRPGQGGYVLLHGMAQGAMPFTVRRVTAVAETDAGRNTFRLEGSLNDAPANLRPGMEGIGKIDVGERSFAWVWTRGLIDWGRMQIWSWTP